MSTDALKVKSDKIKSALNATTTALDDSQSFTGTFENVLDYRSLIITLKSDQVTDYYIDFSPDGVNVDSTITYKFDPSFVEPPHKLTITRQFFRVRVENNSGSNQTYLRVQVLLGDYDALSSPLNNSTALDQDSIVVRPVSFDDEVVIGRRTGVRHFNKFAYRNGLTAANGEETIWASSGNFTVLTTASTFTIAYNNTTDGLGQNGALTLFFDYVDSNGLKATATHTLGNTGTDVTTFSGLGINRVAVASSGSSRLNTNTITVTATTGGTVQAVVPALGSVTQQAIYHVDSNSYAVLKFVFINTNRIGGGSNPKVVVKGYIINRSVLTQFEIFRVTIDTETNTNVTINEEVGFRLNPSDVLFFVADTNLNSTDIELRFSLLEYKID